MRKGGCIVAILGLLLAIAGGAMLGKGIMKMVGTDKVLGRAAGELSLPLDGATANGEFTVEAGKLVQLRVAATLTEDAAAPSEATSYSLPYSVTVKGDDGASLGAKSGRLTPKDGIRTFSVADDAEGKRLHVEHWLVEIAIVAPDSGKISAEASLGANTSGSATVSEASLMVRDGIDVDVNAMAAGVGMLVGGGLLMLLGFILFLVGKKKPDARSVGFDS